MGLVIVGALGINHVNYSKGSDMLDIVPVDICVKGMIVSAWKQWSQRDPSSLQFSEIAVYNAASVKNCTYDAMTMDLSAMIKTNPSVYLFGIPNITFTKCITYAWIIRIFRNLIPALIVDGLLRMTRNKPR